MSESKGSAHRAQRTRKGFMDFWPPGLGRGGHFDLSICNCSLQRTTWTPRRHFVKVRLATKPALNVEGAGPLRQKPWPDRGRRSSVIVQRVREMALRGKELSPCPEPRGERAVVVTGRKSNYVVSVKKPRSRTERPRKGALWPRPQGVPQIGPIWGTVRRGSNLLGCVGEVRRSTS